MLLAVQQGWEFELINAASHSHHRRCIAVPSRISDGNRPSTNSTTDGAHKHRKEQLGMKQHPSLDIMLIALTRVHGWLVWCS
jgi:hypothetical protein